MVLKLYGSKNKGYFCNQSPDYTHTEVANTLHQCKEQRSMLLSFNRINASGSGLDEKEICEGKCMLLLVTQHLYHYRLDLWWCNTVAYGDGFLFRDILYLNIHNRKR